MESLIPLCFGDDMRISYDRLSALNRGLHGIDSSQILNWGMLARELELFLDTFRKEMRDKPIMLMPRKSRLYFQPQLFGPRVYRKFKYARADIAAAGECMAFYLHPAAVFHLMRVVEHGLRRLATNLSISIPRKELDYLGWDKIIGAIEKEIEVRLKMPLSPRSKFIRRCEFYNRVMKDFRAFEHVWRNPTMHPRKRYSAKEAAGIFEQVESFMQQLSLVIPK
jgi:hypothetical protein